MAESDDSTTDDALLGDYRIRRMVSEGTRTRTYEAEQISVRRPVLLERIKPRAMGDIEVVEAFLGDVRAKAGVDHPVIGSVYEAVHDDEAVFYTREVLDGQTFEKLVSAGVRFEPRQVADILRQIGEAMTYEDGRRIATLSLEPRYLVHGKHNVVRIVNLAVAGDADPVVWQHNRELVAELLLDLVAEGKPGATRLSRLLEMLAEDRDLEWERIAHTAEKLAHELSEGAMSISQQVPDQGAEPDEAERPKGIVAVVLVSLLILGVIAVGGTMFLGRKTVPKERDLDGMVHIPAGRGKLADGSVGRLPEFWIDAHEVTIGEYAVFLKALSVITEEQRDVYDHPNQPQGKTDHEPDEWGEMMTAVATASEWRRLRIDVNCPVVGVDWWDAYAYADWRGGRLPTQEEWFRAAEGSAPGNSGWGPVDGSADDQTPSGVYGLAGNVAEWVRDPVRNPAFPMNPSAPAACGASYQSPRGGSLARRWLEDRGARQADLGFRILREAAP